MHVCDYFVHHKKTNMATQMTLSNFLLNLHITHQNFERELNPNLIIDSAQCNSKFHPPHPNVNKSHDEV
jgi:hypothetical protein